MKSIYQKLFFENILKESLYPKHTFNENSTSIFNNYALIHIIIIIFGFKEIMVSMKKSFIAFFFFFFIATGFAFSQATDEDRSSKKNDQESLDESMLSPEQKKQMKAYGKKIKKAKKEKEKKNKATRKQAEKKSAARLSKANNKTRQKKKRYVKTH